MEGGCSLRGSTADVLLRARPYSSDRDARVRALQMAIREWLRPYDRQLLCLQSLLLWERPLHSLLLYSVVNVVFWLLALNSLQLLFLMCSGLVLVVCLDSWRSWAWHQVISEPPCENDSLSDKRSLAYPGILNASQLSPYVAEMWVNLSSLMGDLMLLRQNSPGKVRILAPDRLITLILPRSLWVPHLPGNVGLLHSRASPFLLCCAGSAAVPFGSAPQGVVLAIFAAGAYPALAGPHAAPRANMRAERESVSPQAWQAQCHLQCQQQ